MRGVKCSVGARCWHWNSAIYVNVNTSALRNNKKETPTAVCLFLLEGVGGVSDEVMDLLTKGDASI
jgi:hypothetical protein